MNIQFFYPDKSEIKPDFHEAARYLGYSKLNPPENEVELLIHQCIEEMKKVIVPKAVYSQFGMRNKELEIGGDGGKIEFADVSFSSQDLSKNLSGCTEVILLAATIGSQVDMLIKRTEHFDSVKAAIFQATGAMFIEEVVNLLNDKIKKDAEAQGFTAKPRYSPGYGDVSLDVQKDFFRLLPCTKIGLTLMDTLVMAPEKSVTAFIGLQPVYNS